MRLDIERSRLNALALPGATGKEFEHGGTRNRARNLCSAGATRQTDKLTKPPGTLNSSKRAQRSIVESTLDTNRRINSPFAEIQSGAVLEASTEAG
jgi:hypothetical protein